MEGRGGGLGEGGGEVEEKDEEEEEEEEACRGGGGRHVTQPNKERSVRQTHSPPLCRIYIVL